MTRLGSDPERWLPELRAIISAPREELAGREPSLALLIASKPKIDRCIPDHELLVEYFPDGYTDDPACLAEYAISLSGKRFLASWLILERDLFASIRDSRVNTSGS